jgi:Secretion system C-terminal sorting domain
MRTTIIAAILLMSCTCLQGQPTFNKLLHFAYTDVRFSGVVATDSCYYLKATFTDSVPPYLLGQMFAKLDLEGNLEGYSTIYDPTRIFASDYCNLIGTTEGNFIHFASMGDSIVRTILIKHSPMLDTLFTKQFYSPLYPNLEYLLARVVRQRPDGGYAILFGHESIDDIDFDISLLLLDSTYNIEQFKVYASSPQQETASSMILDTDGGYIIGADRNNENLTSSNFNNRTLILKLNSSGNVVWTWLSPTGMLQGPAEAMYKTPDGGLVVASKKGYAVQINPVDQMIYWQSEVFKLDAQRNLVWSIPLRGHEAGPPTGLVEMVEAIDSSGYVVTGYAADSISGPEPGFGCWLAKVSPEGDSLWARYYSWINGEELNPEPWGMTTTPDGGYVVVGTTLEVGFPVPGWVLKVDSFGCLVPGCHLPNPTMEEAKPEIALSIYPNPTSDFLNFYLRSPTQIDKALFRIVNGEGKMIRTIKVDNLNTTYIVPIHDWPAGSYWLQYFESKEVVISNQFQILK